MKIIVIGILTLPRILGLSWFWDFFFFCQVFFFLWGCPSHLEERYYLIVAWHINALFITCFDNKSMIFRLLTIFHTGTHTHQISSHTSINFDFICINKFSKAAGHFVFVLFFVLFSFYWGERSCYCMKTVSHQ